MRFLVSALINALALWFTTFLVAGVTVIPYETTGISSALTYLLIALIFGAVNAILGTVLRVITFPLYILTLGLISFIINALLLLIVSWISNGMGFGLHITGFWSGVFGAIVLGIFAWLITMILRPFTRHTTAS